MFGKPELKQAEIVGKRHSERIFEEESNASIDTLDSSEDFGMTSATVSCLFFDVFLQQNTQKIIHRENCLIHAPS